MYEVAHKIRELSTERWGKDKAIALVGSHLLEKIGPLFDHHENMESLLQQASQVVVDLLEVEHCVIAWSIPETKTMRVRASYSRNGAKKDMLEGNGQLTSLSFQHINGKHNQSTDREKMVSPLLVKGQVVGYLYVFNQNYHDTGEDHVFFNALGEQIGYAIEMQQIRQLLTSRYALIAISRKKKNGSHGQETVESRLLETIKNPERFAKILARSFYKELRKAGLETMHILAVASEIIENLNETFRKTQLKTEKLEKRQSE